MAITRHVYEIYIKATPERVWQAIVDPAFTTQYFFGTAFEADSLAAGSPYRYAADDGQDALAGEIEVCEPPHRLVMTMRFLHDPRLADEPPGRVEWIVTPVGEAVTRLTVRHGDLFASPKTWASARLGWVVVVEGLKTLLETGAPLGRVDDPEAGAVPDDPEGEWHRQQGIEANNSTWDLLGTAEGERTPDDDEEMTRRAYAAAYHWARAARRGPENDARGEWLLSRVWVVRGNGELALHHADRCAAVVAANGLGDFDLAYAHEARGRALACLGRHEEAAAEVRAARAVPIADDDDRKIVDDDLAAGPWFGFSEA